MSASIVRKIAGGRSHAASAANRSVVLLPPVPSLLQFPGFHAHQVELHRDPPSGAEAANGAEAVFHLPAASQNSAPASWTKLSGKGMERTDPMNTSICMKSGLLPTTGPTHSAGTFRLPVGGMVTSSMGFATGPLHEALVEEVEQGERYLTKVTTGEGGKHTFFSDLPSGGDIGPAPMDYAVSSVGLCTTMTIRLYADRKGWPLKRIRVEVKEDRTKGAGHIPDGLHLTIHLEGDLSEEQRQRLLEIAGKCPVKSIMLGKMPKGVHSELSP